MPKWRQTCVRGCGLIIQGSKNVLGTYLLSYFMYKCVGMKKTILFLYFSYSFLSASAQQWSWAKKANSTTASQSARKICTDNFGNVFMLGINADKANYGPYLTDTGSFIVKYDSIGSVQWAKNIVGTPSSIDCDEFGNLYVSGNYLGSISIGSYNFTSNGDYDFYLIKLDALGNDVWMKSFGGLSTDWCNAVQVDKTGNTYLTGHFWSDSVDLGSFVMKDTVPWGRFYLLKINSVGVVQWANEGIANDTANYANGMLIRLDKNENIYVIANGSISTTFGTSGKFLAKFDSLGNLTWSNFKWNSNQDIPGLAIDDSMNIYALYFFTNQYGGYGTLSKYDSSLNPLWSKYLANGYDRYSFGFGLSLDNSGNVYTAGTIGSEWSSNSDSIQFDNFWTDLQGEIDIAVIKINSMGNLIWIKSTGGAGSEFSQDMCVNGFGDCFLTGTYNWHYGGAQNDTVPFDSNILINDGNWGQAYVSKLKEGAVINSVQYFGKNSNAVLMFPNPSSGIIKVETQRGRDMYISVRDLLGNCLLNKNCRNEKSLEIDLSSQPKGIYFMEIVSDGEKSVNKIILQ